MQIFAIQDGQLYVVFRCRKNMKMLLIKLCNCAELFSLIRCKGEQAMEYITISEAAGKWGITSRRIQVLCSEGRIKGVARLGRTWAIPKNAEKPIDARIKSGKYVKSKES